MIIEEILGKVLDNDYQIISILGKGGMGTVFLAKQLSLNRKVAIKLLPTIEFSPEELQRFEAEIAAMATLCHPNIVTIHHRGKYGEPLILYYVMEYLEGGSLRDYLKKYGRIPPFDAIRFIKQIAEALSYAHKHGFIHRDIKPDNLLFTKDLKTLKIADFGIAKFRNSSGDITKAQDLIGTFLYAAPEQMKWYEGKEDEESNRDIDERADQYSLGIVGYEMIAGRLPYEAKNFIEMMKVLSKPLPPLSEIAGISVPPKVEWLINKMTSKARRDRFKDDETLLETISGIELELAASTTTTRIFAIRTEEECINVPPPIGDLSNSSQEERIKMQNLQTTECAISLSEKPKKINKFLMLGIIGGFILSFLFSFLFFTLIIKNKEKKYINKINNNDNNIHKSKEIAQKSIKIKLKLEINYDIKPPKNYDKPKIYLISANKSILLNKITYLEPNNYQISIILAGYTSEQHGKTLKLTENKKEYILKIHFKALPRVIDPYIYNLILSKKVKPFIYKIDNKQVNSKISIFPGYHKLLAIFRKYQKIEKEIYIPPGKDIYQYKDKLIPLKELLFSFPLKNLSYDIEKIKNNKENIKIYIDEEELLNIHYFFKIYDNIIYFRILIPCNSNTIKIKIGFYYTEILLKDIYLIKNMEKIDINELIKEIKNIDNKKFIKYIKLILKNDKKRLKLLSNKEKLIFYEFLKKKTPKALLKNIKNPILILRAFLNKSEAKERKFFIQSSNISKKNISYKEKIIIWKNFLKKYSNTYYSKLARNLLDYYKLVKKYEDFFLESVQECYISITEKRIILKLEKKIKPQDIRKVRQKIKKYLQENCDKTLEEMIK